MVDVDGFIFEFVENLLGSCMSRMRVEGGR